MFSAALPSHNYSLENSKAGWVEVAQALSTGVARNVPQSSQAFALNARGGNHSILRIPEIDGLRSCGEVQDFRTGTTEIVERAQELILKDPIQPLRKLATMLESARVHVVERVANETRHPDVTFQRAAIKAVFANFDRAPLKRARERVRSRKEGGYGHHLIDRDDKIFRRLPPDVGQEGNPIARQLNDITGRWSARLLVNDQLYLSPEETAFLALDVEVLVVSENKRHLNADELWLRIKDLGGPKFLKRYVLYRYLRRNGWCVRSGLPYGCEYLIYRGTPSAYHAAAGVKMEGQVDPYLFVGFNRALTNTRKIDL
ncbi:unnamed protein product [Nippostrongylus brasiliensis]|uniref:tRNA-intron lyase n=1 Tax=Nippostrongylus brasiliensis TaxID=27835 RepID=A0A0N4YKM4_NIPBR|nr:unnamed protein product [Nippostrongylus brasiliensis]